MPSSNPNIKTATTGTITQAATNVFHVPLSIDLASEVSPDGLPITVTNYLFRFSAIYVHVHTIAGGCTSLTVRMSPDVTADEIIVPDTSSTISNGYTNIARGGVVFKVDVDAFLPSDLIYFTIKTNAGTCNIKEVRVTYERIN